MERGTYLKPDNYMQEVLKTESSDLSLVRKRLGNDDLLRLLHATQGMVTEAGEMVDVIKKHLFYGKPLDEVNLMEELGDSFWYHFVAIDALHTTFDEVARINILKLRKRYGESFSSEKAITRDLDAEREILERKEIR